MEARLRLNAGCRVRKRNQLYRMPEEKEDAYMCYTLEEIKERTTPIAVSYGIQSLGVFGSYARSEATDESDVDICVEKGELRNLFQYFAFVQELEKALGCHVDVVTTEIEDRDFLKRVFKERVLLYER